MPTLDNKYPTLLDVARSLDPDGQTAMLAEMMTRVNPILEHMPYMEGNLQNGHQGSIRTGLPTVAWRILNYGTLPSKSRRKSVTDTCGAMEAFGQIDEEVFKLNGSKDSFRLSEDIAHIEAMSQELATTVFYGNQSVDPEKFTGLAPRFSDLSAENGAQIVDGGGTGSDNMSAWLISWSERHCHGIYPKGSKAGLEFEDLGVETNQDSNGRLMRVVRSHFMQKAGLHIKDWQAMARIANIDASLMIADYTALDIIELMITAEFKIPLRLRAQGDTGRMVWYVTPTFKEALVKLALLNKSAPTLTVQVLENKTRMVAVNGIEVFEVDALTSAEAQVT